MRRGKTAAARVVGGALTGWLVGSVLLAAVVSLATVQARSSARPTAVGIRDVLHDPPLIAETGNPVTLGYEVVCQRDDAGAPCPIRGTLFVRRDRDRSFRQLPLTRRGEAVLAASVVPMSGRGSGFDYYAVLEDGLGGALTSPEAGAAAPQRVWETGDAVAVDLGAHVFGRTRVPEGSAFRTSWGAGAGEAGLITGRETARIGPSAFDVAPGGRIVLLDQVNARLIAIGAGGRIARAVPIELSGGEGDVAVTDDGVAHVLDPASAPVVRSYDESGRLVSTTAVAARGADMLRAGRGSLQAHGYPGDSWFPLESGGVPLVPVQQSRRARSGRGVDGGLELVVRGGADEVQLALVRGRDVVRGWRVAGKTPFGEIQLAEPLGDGLLVVLRVWTSAEAEFVVLALSADGGYRSFAVDAVEWAESSALGRFRLEGRTLYQLRSAPTGVEVVTFDLKELT